MGTVFLMPWAYLDSTDYLAELRRLGFKTVAMALSDDSVAIDDPALAEEPRLAIILGTEGEGLPGRIISESDYVARIPMSRDVDSLNVAAAQRWRSGSSAPTTIKRHKPQVLSAKIFAENSLYLIFLENYLDFTNTTRIFANTQPLLPQNPFLL